MWPDTVGLILFKLSIKSIKPIHKHIIPVIGEIHPQLPHNVLYRVAIDAHLSDFVFRI